MFAALGIMLLVAGAIVTFAIDRSPTVSTSWRPVGS